MISLQQKTFAQIISSCIKLHYLIFSQKILQHDHCFSVRMSKIFCLISSRFWIFHQMCNLHIVDLHLNLLTDQENLSLNESTYFDSAKFFNSIFGSFIRFGHISRKNVTIFHNSIFHRKFWSKHIVKLGTLQ